MPARLLTVSGPETQRHRLRVRGWGLGCLHMALHMYIYIYIYTHVLHIHMYTYYTWGRTSSDVSKVWDLQQEDPDDRVTVRMNTLGVWWHIMLAQDSPPESQRIQATQLDLKCSTHRPELWVPLNPGRKSNFNWFLGLPTTQTRFLFRQLPVNPKPKLKNAQP